MAAIHFTSRTKSALIWGIVGLGLLFLYLVGPIVTPFIWALVTASILNSVVSFATRRVGGRRVVWVILIYFSLVLGLVWGLTVVVPVLLRQAIQLGRELPAYGQQVENFLRSNNIQIGNLRLSSAQINEALQSFSTDFIGGLRARAPELARVLAERLLSVLLYLIATFYFLLQADKMVSNFRGLFPSSVLEELDPWFRRISHTLGSYLRGQALLIVIVSTATFIGLQALGVRFAPVLAITSGLVETIPYLGPYLAGGVATLVAVTQAQPNNFGWPPLMLGLAVAGMYTLIRQIEDNLIMPFVIGRTVELHPLTVLFVVLAGASLAGILGLLLAVPVAATIKIVLEFLWHKIKEPDPRETVAVGPGTTWEDLVRRVRRAPGRRLLLVVPAGTLAPALAGVPEYRRLLLAAGEQGVDLQVITDDAAVAALARSAGVLVDEQPGDQFTRSAAAAGSSARSAGIGAGERREPPAPATV